MSSESVVKVTDSTEKFSITPKGKKSDKTFVFLRPYNFW